MYDQEHPEDCLEIKNSSDSIRSRRISQKQKKGVEKIVVISKRIDAYRTSATHMTKRDSTKNT